MTRNTKYTPETTKRILDSIRAGARLRIAAQAAGISESTFFNWKNQHPDFADAIEQAQAESCVFYLGIIQEAAKTTWQAAAWFLERRFPEDFARPAVQKTIQINLTAADLARMTDQELDDLIAKAEKSER